MPHFLGFNNQRFMLINRVKINAGTPTPPPSFTPSLDFSDDRNSQYLGLI